MKIVFGTISFAVIAITFVAIILKLLDNNNFKIRPKLNSQTGILSYEPAVKELAKVFMYAMLFRILWLWSGS